MTDSEIDINSLSALESRGDITKALLDLAEKSDGYVLVRLVPTKDDPEHDVWFCPAQMLIDWKKGPGNTHVKVGHEIDGRGLRIREVMRLDPQKSKYFPNMKEPVGEAAERVLEEKGYETVLGFSLYSYAGRYVKKGMDY